jgi:monoamine oxidase
MKSIPEKADYLIVGAGVCGLYCAWRLLSKKPELKVVILERLNRPGGRLDTDMIKIGDTTIREEEGGMRFNYSMDELMSVFAAFDLCKDIVPFPMSSSDNQNRYYIRGHSFTKKEAEEGGHMIWSELYDLLPFEIGKSPVEIITDAYNAILAENGILKSPKYPTPKFWQKMRLEYTWRGIPLNQWTLWGIFRDMGYSEECITMLSHTIGFEGPFLSMANAGDAMQILEDFPAVPTYYTFKDGFSTLIQAFVKGVQKEKGEIYLSTNVDKITGEKGAWKVDYTQAEVGQSANFQEMEGQKGTIETDQLILAVPAKAMEALFYASHGLHATASFRQFFADIKSVVRMKLMKINLYFDYPWWKQSFSVDPPIEFGPNFTDLPINAIYPFYSITDDPNLNPAALTIYCDFNNVNFWEGLQNVGPKFDSPQQQKHSKPPQVMYPASQAIVKEAVRQLKLLFNTPHVPEPILTSYRSWNGENDFSYGYHQWALNSNDKEVMKRLVEPIPGVFTCNEAFSDMQGWVNGSLRSSDKVLKKLGIPALKKKHKPCKESKK